jgi:hypothetical protein
MNLPPGALDALRDVHLPEPVAFWPPAPGWWIALGFVLLLAVVAGLTIRARRASLRRAALREIDSLERTYWAQSDDHQLAVALSALLRRVALLRFRRDEVASLHGEARRSFLETTGGERGFPTEIGLTLEQVVYAGQAGTVELGSGQDWIVAARTWIRRNA